LEPAVFKEFTLHACSALVVIIRRRTTMRRIAVCSVVVLRVTCAQVPAAQSEPRFEVASIRPSSPEQVAAGWSGFQSARGLVQAHNVTLGETIANSYGVAEDRVAGGPEWMNSDRYQITAKADQPVGKEVLDAMMRALLAERFKLKLHRETQNRETLTLEVAKHGPKLHRVPAAYPSFTKGLGRVDATTLTMTQFSEILSHELRRPLVDRTGLTGSFKFALRWNEDRGKIADPIDAAGELKFELSTALKDQLGLELKSKRIPTEMLVIDHAEKPSEN
jgi:uncharacterized protein (TIGR03435 family)